MAGTTAAETRPATAPAVADPKAAEKAAKDAAKGKKSVSEPRKSVTDATKDKKVEAPKEAKIADSIKPFVATDRKANPECLMFKHTTDAVIKKYKDVKTPNGFGILDVINSGLKNPDSGVGLYAGDYESYNTFSDLFDPVIEEYHGHGPKDKHITDMNPEHLNFSVGNLDPEGKFMKSTRIRVGRNVAGYPLAAALNNKQRAKVEKAVVKALNSFSGDLKGKYYSLAKLSESETKQLIDDHFLFKKGDRFLEAAGCNKDWPKNRGIFHNMEKTFLVWVNEEDQLRIISMQTGGDIKQVFERLSRAVAHMEKTMKFHMNDHLGVISSCPTNLGTAMRASVHIALPNTSKDMAAFEKICDMLDLQPRGIHGEHSETTGGVFDISNKRRLGLSEVQCAQTLYDGVKKLIELEKKGPAEIAKVMETVNNGEEAGGCRASCSIM